MRAWTAVGQVLTARAGVLADGLGDPLHADLAEISLMSSEKAEAAARSGVALATGAMRLGLQAPAVMAEQARTLGGDLMRGDPAWLSHSMQAGAWWFEQAARLQAEAWAPFQSAVIANAARLKRKR